MPYMKTEYKQLPIRIGANKLVVLHNVTLLHDVDTIKELTDVLVADSAGLGDEGTSAGDVLNVVTEDIELSVDLRVALHLDTIEGIDVELHLLPNEVDNIEGEPVVRELDVDGEMSVHKLHAVLEALGHTDDHVLDVDGHSLDHGLLLGLTEPLLHLDGLVVQLEQVDRHVLKVPLE